MYELFKKECFLRNFFVLIAFGSFFVMVDSNFTFALFSIISSSSSLLSLLLVLSLFTTTFFPFFVVTFFIFTFLRPFRIDITSSSLSSSSSINSSLRDSSLSNSSSGNTSSILNSLKKPIFNSRAQKKIEGLFIGVLLGPPKCLNFRHRILAV